VAGELGTGSAVPLALFGQGGSDDPLPHERQARLEATLAFLRRRFGGRVIVTGRLLTQARRIHLWTFPLGHLLDEPVRVATDHRGTPVRYWRQGRRRAATRRYEVTHIQNRWRETRWAQEPGGVGMTDTDVWRVETDPWGLSELHQLRCEWRVTGVLD
jgi:hypothetical protein